MPIGQRFRPICKMPSIPFSHRKPEENPDLQFLASPAEEKRQEPIVAYTVLLRPAAQRDLDKLSSELRIRIDRILLAFELQPRPQGITKLVGTPDTWRVRVGDYRILLDIDDGAKTVLILRIAHRRDVYR